LKEQLQVFELQYIPTNDYHRASLSFHLTEQEKNDILKAIQAPENQKVFQKIDKIFQK